MSFTLALLAVGAGLVGLALGGEWLVRGAVAVARLAGLTKAVIGLTVVAMGTSLPELVVSLIAALGGTADIALGNVVGSNIANIGLILGLSAVLMALPIHGSAVRLEWPFMFIASWVAMLLARDLELDRLEGGFFVVSLVLFLVFMVYEARSEVKRETAARRQEILPTSGPEGDQPKVRIALLSIAGGVVLLVAGGRLLVDGAVVIARVAGVTERVIGLTVVAVGTSMPELAASVVAAIRRHGDVAIANIIGSNIFNLLGILGITALVRPVPVSAEMVAIDFWWMLGISFLLLPFLWYRKDLSRLDGSVLLISYLIYLTRLL